MDTLTIVILGHRGRQRHPVVVGDLNRRSDVVLGPFLAGGELIIM